MAVGLLGAPGENVPEHAAEESSTGTVNAPTQSLRTQANTAWGGELPTASATHRSALREVRAESTSTGQQCPGCGVGSDWVRACYGKPIPGAAP